ncbi:MAG TPA: hypothetical protein VNT22_05200 [Baekduia sp.]|nr:hypothetical protein [Baekduia sp.]
MSDTETTGGGFLSRARLRRRERELERQKELALRDLGGLLFELHRAKQTNDDLVNGKLTTLKQTDDELRSIRDALGRHPETVDLREAGISACANCGDVIGSTVRFCPTCGTPTQS